MSEPESPELELQNEQEAQQMQEENQELPPSVSETNIEDDQEYKDVPQNEQDFDMDNNFENDVYNIQAHKGGDKTTTRKKKIRRSARDGSKDPEPRPESNPEPVSRDPASERRRLLEERMEQAVKSKVRRRKADEDDLERMQDDRIEYLKNRMIEAANLDVEKNLQGQIATEKLKLLREVMDVMLKADLAISILDNNLLEAVRLWLEPLPDALMPAYQIQKDLIQVLPTLPIKTDHLVASGIGKVLVFYQRSKRTEPNLKKIVDGLVGSWTRPILNKLDSYKDRTIRFGEYNKLRFQNQMRKKRTTEPKTLYEQQAERRNRAAIPSARTTAYKIAPKVDPNLLLNQSRGLGERFNRITRRMVGNKLKTSKKVGPSIEGKNLSM